LSGKAVLIPDNGSVYRFAVHAVSPTVVEKNHEDCHFFWTRSGTDDILVRNTEGALRESVTRFDPDGCLVQQRKHRTYEDAAQAAGGTKPIRQNQVWRVEATLLRKSCRGEFVFLTKAFLWVPLATKHRVSENQTHNFRKNFST
jgi:hypothetical protein